MAHLRPPFSEALKGFFLSKQADGRSPRTIEGYRWTLGMLCDHLTDPRIDEIHIEHLRKFFAYLQTEYRPKNVERLSNHSLNSFWIGIKAFFSWAELEYELKERPDKHLQSPRYVLKEIQPFNEKETRALLKACERTVGTKTAERPSFTMRRPTAALDTALILVMLDTGLRAGEVARLKVADLNLDSGEILVAGSGAGIKSRSRHVYLGSAGRKAVWRYLSKREDVHPTDPLFLTRDNHVMNRSNILHLIVGIGKRAGIRHAHPHRFRHTFAVEFLRNGGNVFTLQRLLGHADLSMTRRYVALVDADAQNAHRTASPVDRWRL